MAQETELSSVIEDLQEPQTELPAEPVPEDSFSISNSYDRLKQLNEDVSAIRTGIESIPGIAVQESSVPYDYNGYFESILSVLDRMEQKMLTSEDLAKGFKIQVLEKETSEPDIQPVPPPQTEPVTEPVTEKVTEPWSEVETAEGLETETETEMETETDPYMVVLESIDNKLATTNNLGIGILIGVALLFGAVCALIFSSYMRH